MLRISLDIRASCFLKSLRSSLESALNIVVYKLGGSLLSLPDLAERLGAVLSHRRDSRPLFIIGGGEAANIVRGWDERHGLGAERAHRLALRAMMLNESLVECLLPRARIVRCRDEAEIASQTEQVPILCAHDFLRSEEAALVGERGDNDPAVTLPHTWDVTSDSIAAWVALRWPAAGLVLLKSRSLARGDTQAERAGERSDLTDPYFSTLAPRLRSIEWINLRVEPPTIETWGQAPAQAAHRASPV